MSTFEKDMAYLAGFFYGLHQKEPIKEEDKIYVGTPDFEQGFEAALKSRQKAQGTQT